MGQNTQRPPTRAPLPPGVLEDSRLSTESRLLLVLLNTRQTAGVVDLHIEQLAVDMGKSASSVSRYLRELRAWRLVSEPYLEPGRGRRVRLMGGSGGWMEQGSVEDAARAIGDRPQLDDVEAQEELEFDDVEELDPPRIKLRDGSEITLHGDDDQLESKRPPVETAWLGSLRILPVGQINGRRVYTLEGMGK